MPIRRSDALASATIVGLSLAVLVPALAQTTSDALKAREESTLSNAKQLGLAHMMYCQDYDEVMAPAVVSPDYTKHRSPDPFSRTGWAAVVEPYIKNPAIFRSPGLPESTKSKVQFMYNDLASGASLAEIASPASSILLMDGEDVSCNTGHAWNRGVPPVGATAVKSTVTETIRGKKFRKTLWKVVPGAGARVQTSPTRFAGQGVYCFLDGHAKVHPPQAVFFPPRASSSTTSLAGEPTPGERGMFSFRLN